MAMVFPDGHLVVEAQKWYTGIGVYQGLVNVPFWEYWTSPYSSHYRLYTEWLGDVQWGHLMTHVYCQNMVFKIFKHGEFYQNQSYTQHKKTT